MVILIGVVQGGGPRVNGKTAGAGTVVIILAVCAAVIYLALRRWRRVSTKEDLDSKTVRQAATRSIQ